MGQSERWAGERSRPTRDTRPGSQSVAARADQEVGAPPTDRPPAERLGQSEDSELRARDALMRALDDLREAAQRPAPSEEFYCAVDAVYAAWEVEKAILRTPPGEPPHRGLSV